MGWNAKMANVHKFKIRQKFTIGELAKDFDVSHRTIRYYESIGLLSPERKGRTRLYDSYQRTRLRLILRGKRIGLTLRDCEKLLDLYETDTGEEAQLLFLLWKIGERKSELEAKRRDIEASYQDLDRVEQNARSRLLEIEAQSYRDQKKGGVLPHKDALGDD